MAFTISLLTPFVLALSAIFAAKLAYDALNRNAKARLPYPPGPKPKLFIGNTLDFPKVDGGRIFAEWGKHFNSDLVHASAFGMHVVVINSREAAEELLEKRPKLYNDRPEVPIVDVMGWNQNVAIMRYGDSWRQHRKLCQQNFDAEVSKQYHPIQLTRVHRFLGDVLYSPENVFDHITLMTISITMLMMYGYTPKTIDDPLIRTADEAMTLASRLFDLGGTLINIMPILRHIPYWVPGATGKKLAERTKRLTLEAKRIPMEHVKAALREGTASSSLVTDFLEKKATTGARPGEEDVVSNVAWSIYGSAYDTTASATGAFLHLVAKHPEVQIKAQEEIDRVIGDNRLPDFSDRPDLPYIEAIYREVLRWHPPMTLAPHASMEDDVYKGYFIPKGAIVLANIWAMTHDENVYPDPFAFKPERYLYANGKLNDDSRVLAYGFGRRICVGKYIASTQLWLVIASFLACFNIGKAKDEIGNEIEIDESYGIGTIIHKKPFKCSITPRSKQTRKLVESTLDS